VGAGVGAGVGIGGGAGIGIGASAGAAAGIGIGAGASASPGGGAGLSASAGFSGLRVESTVSSRPLSAGNLLQASASISSAGKVAPGGRLIDAGDNGLKANVAGEAEFVIGAR